MRAGGGQFRVALADKESYARGKKLAATIIQDEDGMFVAECPAIPGCGGHGKTEEEATEDIRAAIEECLAVRAEQGLPLPVTTREVKVPV